MEKRRSKRVPKRFNVRFGQSELSYSGFTRDISPDGAFIATSNLLKIGTRVHIQVVTSATRSVFFEGVVRRQRVVPPQLRQVEQAGIGISFLSPREVFDEVVPTSSVGNRFEVRFGDVDRLKEAWANELCIGGIFVRTDRHLARDAAVTVVLRLDFANKELEFTAKVMQSVTATVSGLSLGFDAPDKVRTALAPFVGR